MRSRALSASGLSVVAALALATSFAGTANAGSSPVAVGSGAADTSHRSAGDLASCKGGKNLGTPNLDGITAQDFESDFDAYDAQGAADFKLKRACKVKGVYIEGQTGLPTGATIAFHKGTPGAPAKCATTVSLDGSASSFVVPVSGCNLKKGKYWLEASAQLDFGTGGQWFWSTTDTQVGSDDQWQNPGGGFGTTCSSWDTVLNCLGLDYEYIFEVRK